MQTLQNKESRTRGSFGFPIELYNIDETHPRYQMAHHWHAECELLHVLQGEFSYELDGVTGRAKAGDIIFINSGALHAGVPENAVYSCIVFDLNMLTRHNDICQNLLKDFTSRRLGVQSVLPKAEKVGDMCRELFSVLGDKPKGYQLITTGLLYRIFAEIIANDFTQKTQLQTSPVQKKITQLKKALELIETGYMNELSLDELAATAEMTPKYFCRFFHSMTQRTPVDYLNHYRIETACLHLSAGEYSITQIAYECGYNDLSYFIRAFKKYKGATPKQYRKEFAKAG